MKKVRQYYVSLGMKSGFSIDVEVIQQSRDGERLIVKPVAGHGSFSIGKHELKESYK